jgi:hypothetical protein
MNDAMKALDNPEGHAGLVGNSSLYFAARAWEGFKHHGRGALVVWMSKVKVLKDDPTLYTISVKYAPEGSEILARLGFWPDVGMSQTLKEYDPEKEAVFLFVGLNNVVNCYDWRPPESLTPPTAYIKWRAKHPIGIRIDPDTSLKGFLQIAINREFERRRKWETERKLLLADPARQLAFIQTLGKAQQDLTAELKAGGIGTLADRATVYPLDEVASPPRDSLERFLFLSTILQYKAVTAATGLMVITYKQSSAVDAERFRQAAIVGFDCLEDRLTAAMGVVLSSEDNSYLGNDAEEIRKIFLVLTAARLRARMKIFPELRTALEVEARAQGKKAEDILLSKLLPATLMAWSEFEKEPHDDSGKPGKELLNKVANFILALIDLPPLEREQTSLEKLPEIADDTSPLPEFARQLELADELAACSRRLTIAEQEVLILKLQEKTEVEIAKERGTEVGTIKALWSQARRKIKESRKE